ncbi:hypothetical protein [Halapricum hydrolyticum]|uniref:DUF8060 domain-containing protein n=1 Tax=Halapricum hydrolyticum TaxID=2979991 RepID=A0AAE3LED6_9EURY|nr:hypothetical protein [Halapricum hydrolyticum]MCU4717315.1 hypothetical protein [Halapricum hydrolyticum]MCU4726242.1 hypothetical protein [Halapricum hydrolyticum]
MTDTDHPTDDPDEQAAQARSEGPDDPTDAQSDGVAETPSDETDTSDTISVGAESRDEQQTASRSDSGEQGRRRSAGRDERSLRERLELLALIGLALFAAITAYGFYTNASQAISEFVSASYVSLFQAAFNLALLLLALAGLSLLARRQFDFAG